MAYDEKLADRTCEALSGTPGLTEKKMFGGLCFLVRGNGAGVESDPGMAEWTGRGVAFASTLPAKPPMKPKKSNAERRGA